jgi:methoxymalonate biosynthesis acyl carrier protein
MTTIDSTISTQLLDFISGRFPNSHVEYDQDIFSLGFINSLFAMELVMFVEKAFSITISNDELKIDNFRTVEAMTDLVTRARIMNTVGQ